VKRRVVSLVVDAAHTNLWGGELILRDGLPAGFVTSAAFGHTIGKPVALGIVSRATVRPMRDWIDAGRYESTWPASAMRLQVALRAPYDPE
jgi:glycine cleavage system aminomethyltransferase T